MIGIHPIESLRAGYFDRGGCLPCWGPQRGGSAPGSTRTYSSSTVIQSTDPAVLTRVAAVSVLGSKSVDVAQFLPRRLIRILAVRRFHTSARLRTPSREGSA